MPAHGHQPDRPKRHRPFFFSVEQRREYSPGVGSCRGCGIALVCQGTGSHAAFTAGVLQGLLEQAGGDGQIAALAGTSFGSVCALLAWDGLLRGGPQQAVDQLEEFWRDYAAASLVDALLNYSAQMVLHLRAMVPLPVLDLHEVAALGPDQLRRLLDRRVDFAVARSLAARPGAPGLVVGIADAHGILGVCRGPEVSAEIMQAATGILLPGPEAILETHPRSRAEAFQARQSARWPASSPARSG